MHCGSNGCNSMCCKKRGLSLREEKISYIDGIEVPYPADLSVYDANDDLIITFAEFRDAVLSHVDFNHPEDLEEVFKKADANRDGQLDEDEFLTAPWNFADIDEVQQKLPDQI